MTDKKFFLLFFFSVQDFSTENDDDDSSLFRQNYALFICVILICPHDLTFVDIKKPDMIVLIFDI